MLRQVDVSVQYVALSVVLYVQEKQVKEEEERKTRIQLYVFVLR
jgi:hypothetical protein